MVERDKISKDSVPMPSLDQLWEPLTKDEMKKIDETACKLLNEVGFFVDDEELLKDIKRMGCEVDFKNKIITAIPADLIKSYVNRAPKTFTLAARSSHPEWDMQFTGPGEQFYVGTDMEATKVLNWNDEKGVYDIGIPGEKDVIYGAKIVDASPEFDSIFSAPYGAHEEGNKGLVTDIHELYGRLIGSVKHAGINHSLYDVGEWEYIAKLGAEVQGGLEELRKRPLIDSVPSSIGIFQMTDFNCWAVRGSAKWHIPCFPYFACMSPLTGPPTLAASVTLAHACCLFHVALQEFLDPGVPQLPNPMVLVCNPMRGDLVETPWYALGYAAGAQMWHRMYKMPVNLFDNANTKSLDQMMFAMTNYTGQCILNASDFTMLDFGPQGLDARMFPIVEDIIKYWKHLIKDYRHLKPTDENLLVDAMKELGPKGMFASHPSTLSRVDTFFTPITFDPYAPDVWLKNGAEKKRIEGYSWVYGDKVKERLKEMEQHEPDPLPKDVVERMKALVKECDEKYGRRKAAKAKPV